MQSKIRLQSPLHVTTYFGPHCIFNKNIHTVITGQCAVLGRQSHLLSVHTFLKVDG
jgi:hypothetical protein